MNNPIRIWTDRILVSVFRFLRRRNNGARYESIHISDGRSWPVYHRLPATPQSSNDGVPIVFLHGFGNDGSTWLSYFSSLGERREYVAPDLPGFGEHQLGSGVAATPRWYREVTSAFLQELVVRWGQPPILIGKSMGGMIAGLVAGELPELVRALVLIDPSGIQTPEISPFWQNWLEGRNYLLPYNEDDWKTMEAMLYHQPVRIPGFVRRYALETLNAERTTYEHLFDDLLKDGYDPLGSRLSRIVCPVTAIWGAEDRITDPSGARLLKRALPDAEIHLLENCGHSPTREMPERVRQIVLDVLSTYG